jgi:hypothetical protein
MTVKEKFKNEIKALNKELIVLKTKTKEVVDNMPMPIHFSIGDEMEISATSVDVYNTAISDLDKLSDVSERTRVLKIRIIERCESIYKEPIDTLIYEKYLNYHIEKHSIMLKLAYAKLHL